MPSNQETLPHPISRCEWQWVAAWTVVLLLVTGFPYLLGAALSTPQSVFGGSIIAVEDGNTYLAAMRQGAAGAWLFHVPFTTEAHSPGLVFLFYLVLGKIAAGLNLSLPLTLQLSKLVTTPLLMVAVYQFMAHFSDWVSLRRVGFLLAVLGGGLGWLWLLAGEPFAPGVMPIDLWVPDAFAFLTVFTFPHLALAQALILFLMVLGQKIVRRPNWRGTVLAAGLGLLLSQVHPYSLPLVLVVLGLWWLWRWRARSRPDWSSLRSLLQLGVVGLVSAPYLGYVFLLFANNPVFHSWQEQNRIRSPNPVHYVLGYGLLSLLVLVAGLHPWVVRRIRDYRFLGIWLVLVPILLYVPSNLQRRFLDGYQMPVTVVAVAGLLYLLKRVPSDWRRRSVLALVVVSTFSNLLLLTGATMAVVNHQRLVFHPGAVLAAADWMEKQVPADSRVLAGYDSGNLLPARALVRSFVGHGPQSVDADLKLKAAERFFAAETSDTWREQTLAHYGIDYLFYGPDERALGGFDPAVAAYLQPVYRNDQVTVYRVLTEEQP